MPPEDETKSWVTPGSCVLFGMETLSKRRTQYIVVLRLCEIGRSYVQPQVPLKSIKILSVLPFVILFTGLQWGPAWGDELTPVGRWKTIDDKTGKPKGIVNIYE